jgi:hypothetical protein
LSAEQMRDNVVAEVVRSYQQAHFRLRQVESAWNNSGNVERCLNFGDS